MIVGRLRRFGLTLGDLGQYLEKQIFAVDWILSGSRSNTLTEHFDKLHGEGARLRMKPNRNW